jgi:hypothetical protein
VRRKPLPRAGAIHGTRNDADGLGTKSPLPNRRRPARIDHPSNAIVFLRAADHPAVLRVHLLAGQHRRPRPHRPITAPNIVRCDGWDVNLPSNFS